MTGIDKFSDKADLYFKYRPSYSQELLFYLYNYIGFNKYLHVADIGSGTGLFSELILKRGSHVYAVEPNDSMRMIAEKNLSKYPLFHSIKATGENCLLQNNSIDFITVVQSFHWLDAINFKAECKRILKQNGKVVIVYNRKRKNAEVNVKTAELLKRLYPEYKDVLNNWELRENPIKRFFNYNYEFLEFENTIFNNLEEFIGRALSASFVNINNTDIKEFEELFNRYSQTNIISIPNDTIAYIGVI